MQDRYDKLIESAVHLMNGSAHDPNFGMTKLVKLLYYADCTSYILHGESITGTTYIHFPHGPYPENWYIVRQNMETSGAATIIRDASARATIVTGFEPIALRIWNRSHPKMSESWTNSCSDSLISTHRQSKSFPSGRRLAGDGKMANLSRMNWLALLRPNLSPISIEIGLEIAKNIHGR